MKSFLILVLAAFFSSSLALAEIKIGKKYVGDGVEFKLANHSTTTATKQSSDVYITFWFTEGSKTSRIVRITVFYPRKFVGEEVLVSSTTSVIMPPVTPDVPMGATIVLDTISKIEFVTFDMGPLETTVRDWKEEEPDKK